MPHLHCTVSLRPFDTHTHNCCPHRCSALITRPSSLSFHLCAASCQLPCHMFIHCDRVAMNLRWKHHETGIHPMPQVMIEMITKTKHADHLVIGHGVGKKDIPIKISQRGLSHSGDTTWPPLNFVTITHSIANAPLTDADCNS